MSDPKLAVWLYLMVLTIMFLFGKSWQALWGILSQGATAKAAAPTHQ
jgi:hypothetical protein